MKTSKNHSSLIILIGLLTKASIQNINCMVDHCATCPNGTTPVCTGCEYGWYLKSFTAHEGKPYDDCWWSWYWWLAFIAILIFLILSIVACYFLYLFGERSWLQKGGIHKNGQQATITQRYPPNTVYATNSQPTLVYDTEPSTARQVIQMSPRSSPIVYSNNQSPTVIRAPNGNYSPRNLSPNYSPKTSVLVRTQNPNRQF